MHLWVRLSIHNLQSTVECHVIHSFFRYSLSIIILLLYLSCLQIEREIVQTHPSSPTLTDCQHVSIARWLFTVLERIIVSIRPYKILAEYSTVYDIPVLKLTKLINYSAEQLSQPKAVTSLNGDRTPLETTPDTVTFL